MPRNPRSASGKAAPSRLSHAGLNIALAGLGVIVLILVYALAQQTFNDNVNPERTEAVGHLMGEIIQVEVRNGCGVAGLAQSASDFLREKGFDVVDTGNYHSFEEAQSKIIDRVGQLDSARKVARILGIPDSLIIQEPNENVYLDVTVVLGQDYATLKPFVE